MLLYHETCPIVKMQSEHLVIIDQRLESIQQAGEESVATINIVKNILLDAKDSVC